MNGGGSLSALELGHRVSIAGPSIVSSYELPSHDRLTHGVVAGMTGCGKTGLAAVIVDEALRTGIPVLAIDVRGDRPICCSRSPRSKSRR